MAPKPPIVERNGRLWLDPDRVEGEMTFTDFEIVEWEGKHYELQGRRPSDGLWWIELILEEMELEETKDPRLNATT